MNLANPEHPPAGDSSEASPTELVQVLIYDETHPLAADVALNMLDTGQWHDFPESKRLRRALKELARVHPALDDWPGVEAVGKRQKNFRCFDFESKSVPEYAAVVEFFTARGFTTACGPTRADT